MRKPEDFAESVRLELLRLYVSTKDWSHRRLQKEILDLPADPRGGGFVAMTILRSFGLLDDSLKGVLESVKSIEELIVLLDSKGISPVVEEHLIGFYQDKLSEVNTFLLIWNPKSWEWETLNDEVEEFKIKGELSRGWGCGNTKSIKEGDRLFLIKLGSEHPRGIMASGIASKGSYRSEHWSGEEGKLGWFVDIEFDVLLNPKTESDKMISYDNLVSDETLNTQEWSIQSSGIRINPTIAKNLEMLWHSRFKEIIGSTINNNISNTKYSEGGVVERLSRRYERDRLARSECLKIHGTICSACKLDFEQMYGTIGRGFIHVHHVVPISQRNGKYAPDPARDLIPLCPNCHAMIHKLSCPYLLEDLIKLINKKVILERE